MIFLELNDWQLSAWNDRGDHLIQQCAGASTAQGQLVFGDHALRYSRSHPQQFNNRYLYSLAAEPLPGDLSPARNHADLVYHHLLHLSLPADEAVAICVGGHVTNQQLGVLLGICQEAGIKVAGFIDAALAQSLSVPASGDYHVLDIELHRMTLSHISVAESQRKLVQSATFDGAGAANIIEGWMNVTADEFVQKTRFDPLHAGQTEQQLFDQVSTWITQAAITDHRVSVSNGEASRDIEVSANLLTSKLRQRLTTFDLSHVHRLILSPRTAAVAGLRPLLAEHVAYIEAAGANDLPHNCNRLADALSELDVRRVVQADIAIADVDAPRTDQQQASASHLLLGDTAYALSSSRFAAHPEIVESRHTPGDTVNVGGEIYRAIRLE